jgi:hypothetical protein
VGSRKRLLGHPYRSGYRDLFRAADDLVAAVEDGEMKPLCPRTKAVLKELMRSWDEALSEPLPADMKELLAKLK